MSKLKETLQKDKEELVQYMKTIKPWQLIVLSIMLVITILSFVFYGFFFSTAEDSFFVNPETGVAFFDSVIKFVPTLLKCIQLLTVVLLVKTIAVTIIKKTVAKSQRGFTVASLLCSIINWLTVIVTIIIILSYFGVNTTALITGAGVLTLVVGLGMQSLIADIVAGLFIVFENEFNVGDIITIEDFRGEVVEIGIRTTKLKALGNIKIINNSDIRAVLNQSVEPSVAKTLIDVEYGTQIPEVEKIIKENIGKLQIPGALDSISYDGVATLGASGVTLQFTCHCKEADIYAVTRAMNGAIKNMFDVNGIGIPFPQIVVHQGHDKDE